MTKLNIKTQQKTSSFSLFSRKFALIRREKTISYTNKPPIEPIYRENLSLNSFAVKERDEETGLYYFGARYLDARTSRWLSVDPALGEFLPVAPNSDEARRHNQNLPGMGGIYNYVNFHVYNYGGNNPIKYKDPDGDWIIYSIFNSDTGTFRYGMTIHRGLNRLAHAGGGFIPFVGPYMSNMSNSSLNFGNLLTEKNYRIEYDSAAAVGIDSVSLVMDILSLTTIGVSRLFQFLELSMLTTDALGTLGGWRNDNIINNFLNAAGNGLFHEVGDRETAIILGNAFAIGANIYRDKDLRSMGISERDWAFAIRAEVLGIETLYSGMYRDVMSRLNE